MSKIDYEKLLKNIEYENTPHKQLPDYLMRYFCMSLNYQVQKYVEEKEKKQQKEFM